MTREEYCAKIQEAINQFDFGAPVHDYELYGNGHINDTFMVHTGKDGTGRRYIIQRINTEVFRNPQELMENIAGVTAFLRKKIIEAGGDPERETLNIVKTKNGENFCHDDIGCCWRVYPFVENTDSFDEVKKPEDFYQSAVAFGHFQNLLAEYPAAGLHETIRDFHNTPVRYRNFMKALKADALGRAKNVQPEIEFVLAHEKDTHVLMDQNAAGNLPLKVTHNDTKLNNVLFDHKTGRALCVIDLDTIMPGFATNDFGDSIRFGANTGAEDERDLSKVGLNLGLYDIYLKGFLEECRNSLNETEVHMLRWSAKLMTLECGIRFLTDYLEGDSYFRIHREGQNLDRCRSQFKLVSDMEEKWDEMEQAANRYL